MIKRDIVFAYKDDLYLEFSPYFKIYKCPDNFPQPPHMAAHNPYFIEYKVEKAPPKKGLKGSRQIKKGSNYNNFKEEELSCRSLQNEQNNNTRNEYIVLLNVLTANYVFTYEKGQQGWAINLEGSLPKSSYYSQAGYIPPDYDSELEELKFNKHYEIFDLLLAQYDPKGNLVRNVGLKDLISIYKLIGDLQFKKSFLNACIVFNKAQYLAEHEISASYMFMVASLEALVAIENHNIKTEICDSCNNEKFKVSEKFKVFIDKYGYGIDNKTKNDFYGLRSRISHKGQLLIPSYDRNFYVSSQNDLKDEWLYFEQMDIYNTFKNLTQVCFSKFLLSLEPKKQETV